MPAAKPEIRERLSPRPSICIISYISGELVLPVSATRINMLMSPTWPLYESGDYLYSFVSGA